MPVFVIPGNHDAREPLREAFRDAGYLPAESYLQFAIEDYPLRLVALDTLVPGENGGMLCAERLGWLDTALPASTDRDPDASPAIRDGHYLHGQFRFRCRG
jgi:3',5'-cyclic-AMP phosphodiesterase